MKRKTKPKSDISNKKRLRVSSNREFQMIMEGLKLRLAEAESVDSMPDQYCCLDMLVKVQKLKD